MNTEVDRAAALLFPSTGRRAIDVKFFFTAEGATVQALAQQVIVSFDGIADGRCTIASIDRDLTR